MQHSGPFEIEIEILRIESPDGHLRVSWEAEDHALQECLKAVESLCTDESGRSGGSWKTKGKFATIMAP